jgi:hypothetical protein
VYSIKEWIEYCFSETHKNWEDYIVLKDNFIPEFSTLVSNPSVIKSLGWEPKIGFHQLADIMMCGNSF